MFIYKSQNFVSVKEFCTTRQPARSSLVDIKFLMWCIKTLWEQSGKAVKGKDADNTLKPITVAHIDANIMPKDIIDKMDGPMYSKLKLIYTGPTPMAHENEDTMLAQLISDADKLHDYLPVLFKLGVATILPPVPSSYTNS